jgi:hypothetical protein
MNRAMMNDQTSVASPLQTADTKESTPIQMSVGRQLKRSVGQPPTRKIRP